MIESRIKSFMRKDNCANFLRTEKLYIIVTLREVLSDGQLWKKDA